ncbi:MAG: DUF169 domain-containing protein [Thermoleophilia bacterium]
MLSPTSWHFAAVPPRDAVSPRTDTWTCVFALMNKVQSGKPASFTAQAPGCVGASNYLGFNGVPPVAAALYLAGKERLKKDAGLAVSFYNEVQAPVAKAACLVFNRLDSLPDNTEVEVVNLWVDAASLSVLHTLANYDRATNDNVIMPFSSGCQSIWTLPYKEAGKEMPKAVAGSLDPTVRGYLPEQTISFSAPAERFVEMCANIEGSFLAP